VLPPRLAQTSPKQHCRRLKKKKKGKKKKVKKTKNGTTKCNSSNGQNQTLKALKQSSGDQCGFRAGVCKQVLWHLL
jgi:hypothetical protein